jgi:hypothetical protein
MAVRVKLRLKPRGSDRTVETSALVNSGFEAETPQLLIPTNLAKQIQLYPPPPTSTIVEVGTAAGPARLLLIREALDSWVVAGDREVGPKPVDVMISPMEEEVLISDKLAEEFNIVLLAIGSGKWRFADDPSDKTRYSEKPQYW